MSPRHVFPIACLAVCILAAASLADGAQPAAKPPRAPDAASEVILDNPACGNQVSPLPSDADDGTAEPAPAASPPPDGSKGKKEGEKQEKAAPKLPSSPYKTLYFDNDFTYLDDPDFDDYRLGDCFKRLDLGCDTRVDVGGEFRLRHHHEVNLRNSNLTGLSDDFLLWRTRHYLDVKHGGWVRFYGELIDAASSGEEIAPRGIEENRYDALNLFGELRLYEDSGDELWLRVGRQEQAYGAERLISPLDWANTRRTFDGAKLIYKSQDWNVDAFWLRPVPFSQHVNNDHNFDQPDQSQDLEGLYAVYKGIKDNTLEWFYLRYAEDDALGTPANPADFDLHTIGGRWLGKSGSFLMEIEWGIQLGEYGGSEQLAGYCTCGLGYEFADAPWTPTLWAYYDWASGDENPVDGHHGTFNQLFPLGHKYFGFADLVARQNVEDLNFLLTASPSKKVKLLAWWHVFHLAEKRDSLYNAQGVPIRIDPTGASGSDVGQELDLTCQLLLTPRVDVLFGYSHFFGGDFVQATNPPGVTGDANFYYTQFSVRF